MANPILLITNDESTQNRLFELFSLHQFSVNLARNYQEALAKALNSQPSLILCYLPNSPQDSYQLLNHFKQHPKRHLIPFILITNHDSRQSYRTAMELGADDYLAIPFTQQEILQAVQSCLKRKELIFNQLEKQQTKIKKLNEKLEKCLSKQNLLETTVQEIIQDLRGNSSKIKLGVYLLRSEITPAKKLNYLELIEQECTLEIETIQKLNKLKF